MRNLTKHIPYGWKAWLRTKVIPPIQVAKYYPYRGSAYSYVIPKSNSHLENPSDTDFPVPPTHLWSGYDDYLPSGERDVSSMLDILNDSGFSLSANCRILDFGCSAGRMIRWLKGSATTCEIWGTDISSEHIFWCKQHLTPPFNFLTTTTIPHLPFEDRYFDLIYAGSVFTHIDDLADAWLLELRRILSDDGRIYITLLDKNSLEILNEKLPDARLSRLIRSDGTHMEHARSDFGIFTIGRDTSANVFYDLEYLGDVLEPRFEIISTTKEAYGFQTALLMSKR